LANASPTDALDTLRHSRHVLAATSAARAAEVNMATARKKSTSTESQLQLMSSHDRIAIVAGLRTPFARSWTDLDQVDPVELSTQVARELLFRLDLPLKAVDQVVWGTVVSVPRSPNIGREVALNLGMYHASGFAVSRACASGLQAIASASEMIQAGVADAVLAGGVDVISHAPVTYKKRVIDTLQRLQKAKGMALLQELRNLNPIDLLPTPPALSERYTGLTMGEHAEEMAQNFGISREAQDQFAIASHHKAHAAVAAGLLADEVMTVQTPSGQASADNIIRADMDASKLAKLKPVFDRRNGTITAASSSALTDGAAACLVMRESKARALGLPILGFVRSYAFAGQDPRENMLLGNVYSTPVALDRAGLSLDELDRIEIHEAFAAQVLSNLKCFADQQFFKDKLGRDQALGEIDRAKLNVRGGSLAYGHPFAATGVRLITSLLRTLAHDDKSVGLATACAAGGMGGAMVVERA
jgi:acetyl-CoA acyltransferase